MVEDRYFYDPVSRRYTVDRFLATSTRVTAASTASCSGPSTPTSASTTATSSTCCATCPAACRRSRQMVDGVPRRRRARPLPQHAVGQSARAPKREVSRRPSPGCWPTSAPMASTATPSAASRATYRERLRRHRPPAGLRARRLSRWRRDAELGQHDLGLLEVPVHPHDQPRQMAGAAPHGQRLRPLEQGQDRQPASRLLQRRGLRNLGEHLGHLERHHASAMPRPSAAWPKSSATSPITWSAPDWEPHTPTLQYGVFASKWPARRPHAVDHRQPHRLQHRRPATARFPRSPACAISISGTARS